jgi:uncharacterized CHY-type Zn-finger protein
VRSSPVVVHSIADNVVLFCYIVLCVVCWAQLTSGRYMQQLTPSACHLPRIPACRSRLVRG